MAFHDDLAWFSAFKQTPRFERLRQRPVAYFCAEFALADGIPTYSGGLGVLAGDVVRVAADRGLPMIAVGLYYNQGYICKTRDDDGEIVEMCTDIPPESVGLKPVVDEKGERILVSVPIRDGEIQVHVWRYDVRPASGDGAMVPVYLMDTNISVNSESDRGITNRLYVGDKEIRLKQEIILGIGGLRLVEKLGIHPAMYHLNEGHSAFLSLELTRHQMEERRLGFAEAKQFARRRIVFTNHTLVAAGNEVYDNDLVSLMLGPYCGHLGVPIQDVVELGLVHESSMFSMTMLSMRMAGIVNGVSKLHAEKAKQVWANHPMVGITNGVHLPTWDAFSGEGLSGGMWKPHQLRKQRLLSFIRETSGRHWHEDELLLGWARRITRYKRPLSILEDAQRFATIARQQDRPVRLVIAGQPHPSDEDGKAMLQELRRATRGDLSDIAAYIPDYSVHEAKLLTSGCDVWMNTPILGYEASGTSGMKAALNGVLPFSTKDGWMAEIDFYGVGWPVDSERIGTDLLDVLERDIVPLYYEHRSTDGTPLRWQENMHNARRMIIDRFNASRMLREYAELLYS